MKFKKKKRLSENEAKNLFINILEYMWNQNIISENDYYTVGKTNFHVQKDKFKFFFKSYNEALLKLEKTIYYQQLINFYPIFTNLITDSFKAGFDLLFNHYYHDDFEKEYTNLPVHIWFTITKKRKVYNKYNYPRLIIQNSSQSFSYITNILTIKLVPNIEIVDNFLFKNQLKTDETEIIFKWIKQNLSKILHITHSQKYYFKQVNFLRNSNIWKI